MDTYYRYFIVNYIRKPDGKTDELIRTAKKLKTADLDLASVILDLAQQKVIKASLGDKVVPRDFQRIRDFYHQHYAKIIEDIEGIYQPQNSKQETT